MACVSQLMPFDALMGVTQRCAPCSPETGRKLRFGPAMTARMATVELPLVTALFADISAAGPKRQRAWAAAAPQPAQRGPAAPSVRRPPITLTRHGARVPWKCSALMILLNTINPCFVRFCDLWTVISGCGCTAAHHESV